MKRLVVRIATVDGGGPVEERVFRESPVSIGSGSRNALRLFHPMVAPHQGVLAFTAGSIQYTDYHAATTSLVDGVPVAPGATVGLPTDGAVLAVGPFRCCVDLQS